MQIKFPLKKFKPHTNKGTCALQNPGFGFSEPKVLGKKKKVGDFQQFQTVAGLTHP